MKSADKANSNQADALGVEQILFRIKKPQHKGDYKAAAALWKHLIS